MRVGQVIPNNDMAESSALLLPFSDYAKVLGSVDHRPLRFAEVVQTAGEEHVERVHECIGRRRQFHRWNICRGLGEKDISV